MCVDREKLLAPFDNIRNRRGQAGKMYDYIPSEDMLQRVIDATEGQYSWTVVTVEFKGSYVIEKFDDRANEMKKVTRAAYWMVHGRLDIPGLGCYDGIGTGLDENEDGVKGAETDAFKRAVLKTGVGIDIYRSRREQTDIAEGRRRPAPPRAEQTRAALSQGNAGNRQSAIGNRAEEASPSPNLSHQGRGTDAAEAPSSVGMATAAQVNAIRSIADRLGRHTEDLESLNFDQASMMISELNKAARAAK